MKPTIIGKIAITLDGKIAMPSGESKWITGERSRERVHLLRSRYVGIAIGRKTLERDNPRLTDRISQTPKNPVQIVFTKTGNIPLNTHFVNQTSHQRIIITGNQISNEHKQKLEEFNITVFVGNKKEPTLDWALSCLYKSGITSILVEGGGTLMASFIRESQLDGLYIFQSGKVIGSKYAPSWVGKLDITKLSEAPQFVCQEIEKMDDDIMMFYTLKRK